MSGISSMAIVLGSSSQGSPIIVWSLKLGTLYGLCQPIVIALELVSKP